MKTYKQITPEMIQKDIRYLELLSHDFLTWLQPARKSSTWSHSEPSERNGTFFWPTCTGNTKLSSMCSAMLPELSNGR